MPILGISRTPRGRGGLEGSGHDGLREGEVWARQKPRLTPSASLPAALSPTLQRFFLIRLPTASKLPPSQNSIRRCISLDDGETKAAWNLTMFGCEVKDKNVSSLLSCLIDASLVVIVFLAITTPVRLSLTLWTVPPAPLPKKFNSSKNLSDHLSASSTRLMFDRA